MSGIESSQGCEPLQASSAEQLIPGIPNEIALDHITPKLPWRVFHVLSSVSRIWLRAIRTREVYDARARNRSTQTFVLLKVNRPDDICVYSMIDNSFCLLPRIPEVPGGLPVECGCVALDGKVYVVGGERESRGDGSYGSPASNAVYVLDMAAQGKWRKCASMNEGRAHFGCSVANGKIYAFGGVSCFRPVSGSEVYDPKENIWSPISSSKNLRYCHKVEPVGEELLLYSGTVLDPVAFNAREVPFVDPFDNFGDYEGHLLGGLWELYHPVKDEWRQVRRSGPQASDKIFVADGKIYLMSAYNIHVLNDVNGNVWTHLHSFRFDVVGYVPIFLIGPPYVDPFVVQVVDDEILVIVRRPDYPGRSWEYCLLQSSGFKSKNRNLEWQVVRYHCHDMFLLQL